MSALLDIVGPACWRVRYLAAGIAIAGAALCFWKACHS